MPGRETQLLFDSPVARITRVRARQSKRHHAATVERSSGHRLVLPIASSFLVTIGGNQLLIDPAATLLINGGEPYQLEPAHGKDFTALVFALKAFDATSARHFAAPLRFFAASVHLEIAQALTGRGTRQNCEHLTNQRFATCASGLSNVHPLPAPVERCRRLLSQKDLGTPTCLNELADQAHSTRYHLTRGFRRATGLNLQQYRHHLRLVQSLRDIEAGTRSLTAIALDAGFASPSHFSTAFRMHFGISPSGLRRSIAQVSESAVASA